MSDGRLKEIYDIGSSARARPVGPLQEIDEIDPQRLSGLAHLPVLPHAGALQVLPEPTDLVGHGRIGR